MTLQISSIAGDARAAFDKAVSDHIAALGAFNHTLGKPRPTAHPLVEQAIKRVQVRGKPDTYVADYVFTEPELPVLSLEDKKNNLHAALDAAEKAAKNRLLPERKIRLATIKYSIAVATPECDRTTEQAADIPSFVALQKAWQDIELKSAQALSDIDDLTEDNVDSWQLPNFG